MVKRRVLVAKTSLMWLKIYIFAPETTVKTTNIMASEIRNPQLWQDGRLKIDWVRHHMPLLNGLEEEFPRRRR